MLWALPVSLCLWDSVAWPALQGVHVSTLQRKGQNLGGVFEVSMDAPISLQPGHDNGCLQNRNPPNPMSFPALHKTPSRNVCSCPFFLPSILPFQSACVRDPVLGRPPQLGGVALRLHLTCLAQQVPGEHSLPGSSPLQNTSLWFCLPCCELILC